MKTTCLSGNLLARGKAKKTIPWRQLPYTQYKLVLLVQQLTLKVLVTTIDAQWEGMGDVGSARYEPALLPPMPDHKGFKLQ